MLNSFYYDFGARLISLTPTFIIEPLNATKPPIRAASIYSSSASFNCLARALATEAQRCAAMVSKVG